MNNGLGMGFVFPLTEAQVLRLHTHIHTLPSIRDDQLHVIPSFNANEKAVH